MKDSENKSFRKLIHDIRGSLSPILMYAQLIAYHADKTPESVEAIKKSALEIESKVKSLASMLNTVDDSERV